MASDDAPMIIDQTDMTPWTCIVRCGHCGRELNRAEHVPACRKISVSMTAAFNVRCACCGQSERGPTPRYVLEWLEEHHDDALWLWLIRRG